jgi:hypothetical protein
MSLLWFPSLSFSRPRYNQRHARPHAQTRPMIDPEAPDIDIWENEGAPP